MPFLIRLRQRFLPFEAADTAAYLVHEVMTAGGNYDAVFRPGAAAAVHAYAAGVPRVINNLCETALAVAARRKAPAVTAELVSATAIELCGLQPLAAAKAAAGDAEDERDPLDGLEVVEMLESEDTENIPTLTESVEIDIDSGAYALIVNGDTRG